MKQVRRFEIERKEVKGKELRSEAKKVEKRSVRGIHDLCFDGTRARSQVCDVLHFMTLSYIR